MTIKFLKKVVRRLVRGGKQKIAIWKGHLTETKIINKISDHFDLF